MPPSLTGPSLPPRGGGKPQQLIVLLHGVGADGNDLINLAPFYQRVLPQAHIVSPNAPFPFDMAPFGYMWFSLADFGPETRSRGVITAAPTLEAFLEAELARHGVSPDKLLLIGFSQGAMMALHVGLRRATPPAGIIAHSGMLVAEDRLKKEITGRPPVLMTHGADDPVIPAAALEYSAAALRTAGVPVEAHRMPDLAHGIDEATLRLDMAFLAKCFGGTSVSGDR